MNVHNNLIKAIDSAMTDSGQLWAETTNTNVLRILQDGGVIYNNGVGVKPSLLVGRPSDDDNPKTVFFKAVEGAYYLYLHTTMAGFEFDNYDNSDNPRESLINALRGGESDPAESFSQFHRGTMGRNPRPQDVEMIKVISMICKVIRLYNHDFPPYEPENMPFTAAIAKAIVEIAPSLPSVAELGRPSDFYDSYIRLILKAFLKAPEAHRGKGGFVGFNWQPDITYVEGQIADVLERLGLSGEHTKDFSENCTCENCMGKKRQRQLDQLSADISSIKAMLLEG